VVVPHCWERKIGSLRIRLSRAQVEWMETVREPGLAYVDLLKEVKSQCIENSRTETQGTVCSLCLSPLERLGWKFYDVPVLSFLLQSVLKCCS